MATKFRNHFMSMDHEARMKYAARADTSELYIRTHLICVPPRKTPRKERLQALADASNGQLTLSDVLTHFFDSQKKAA